MDKEELTIEDAKTENIYSAIWNSRQHPGVSLENIAAICAKIFDQAELEAFIKDLSKLCEAHSTKGRYCCAYEYDLAVFEKKLQVLRQKLLGKIGQDLKEIEKK